MSDDQSLEDRIRRDVLKTGYPTEVLTATSLTARDWHCVLGPSYLDANEKVSREFDLRSYRQLRSTQSTDPIVLGCYLLIECKKSDKPWVFFTAPSEIERHDDMRYGDFIYHKGIEGVALFTRSRLGKEPVVPHDSWRSFHHYATHERWGHNYYEPFKNQEKADRSIQIHTAIHSVVNATRYYIQRAGPVTRWIRLYCPVIVFDGELFEARVVAKDNIEIIPTDHIVLKHHTSADNRFDDREGVDGRVSLIDVIRLSFADQYCDLVGREQALLLEKLETADLDGRLTS